MAIQYEEPSGGFVPRKESRRRYSRAKRQGARTDPTSRQTGDNWWKKAPREKEQFLIILAVCATGLTLWGVLAVIAGSNVANHADVLVWKQLGDPCYDVLTIT